MHHHLRARPDRAFIEGLHLSHRIEPVDGRLVADSP
jgi:hypothetical protein